VDCIRRDFRLTVDLHNGEISPRQVEILQPAPAGDLYYRDYAGALRPVAGESLHSGDLYLITRLHTCLAEAKQEAAAELERRGEHLRALALRCRDTEEANNG